MNINLLSESVSHSRNISTCKNSDSLITEALEGILEIKKENNLYTEQFYKRILEAAGNPVLIVEASDGLLDMIKNIIEKFLDLIKKIVAKFLTNLNKLVKSDKFIKKNKDKLLGFDSADEFEMDLYTYTYLDNDTFPNTKAYSIYKYDDTSEINSKVANSGNTIKDVMNYTNSLYDKMSDKTEWYDKFRGIVLTDDTTATTSLASVPGYSSSEYSSELRLKYRNGDSSKTSTTVTSDKVINAYNRFEDYKKISDHVKSLSDKLQKEYKAIKNDIKGITAVFGSGDGKYTSSGDNWTLDVTAGTNDRSTGKGKDLVDAYNTATDAEKKKVDETLASIIKAKANQIDQMCTIHTMAFTAKLDAIKECYEQDKNLLYKALQKTNRFVKHESYTYDRIDEDIPIYISL